LVIILKNQKFATANWRLQKSYKNARWQLLKLNKDIGDNFEQTKMGYYRCLQSLIECLQKCYEKALMELQESSLKTQRSNFGDNFEKRKMGQHWCLQLLIKCCKKVAKRCHQIAKVNRNYKRYRYPPRVVCLEGSQKKSSKIWWRKFMADFEGKKVVPPKETRQAKYSYIRQAKAACLIYMKS